MEKRVYTRMSDFREKWGFELIPGNADLLEILTQKIKEMVEKDYRKFMNDLYRLDVSEEKTQQIFSTKKGDEKYAALAELVLNREIQKMKNRQAFEKTKIEE